jgi:hypothetical protein
LKKQNLKIIALMISMLVLDSQVTLAADLTLSATSDSTTTSGNGSITADNSSISKTSKGDFKPVLKIVSSADTKKIQPDITPAQEAKLKTIMDDLDLQVKQAFKGEEKFQLELDAELKKISVIKDDAGKKAAIDAYQNKYLSRYDSILKKGNVNLNNTVNSLNTIFPDRQFSLTNKLAIIGKAKTSSKATASSSPTLAEGPTTFTLKSSDFTSTKDIGCGLIAGGGVSFSNQSITTNAFSTVAGKCFNYGKQSALIDVPRNTRATFEVAGDFNTTAFAIGVGVASYASAHSATFIGLRNNYNANSFANALAPILWSAYSEESVGNARDSFSVSGPVRHEIAPYTSAGSTAATLGTANAEAKVRNLRVTVKFEPL